MMSIPFGLVNVAMRELNILLKRSYPCVKFQFKIFLFANPCAIKILFCPACIRRISIAIVIASFEIKRPCPKISVRILLLLLEYCTVDGGKSTLSVVVDCDCEESMSMNSLFVVELGSALKGGGFVGAVASC